MDPSTLIITMWMVTASGMASHLGSMYAVNTYKDLSDSSRCPCSVDDIESSYVPSFVGQDFFCDSGAIIMSIHYGMDKGYGNTATRSCCSFNNLPWFCKGLPEPTSEDIELWICANSVLLLNLPVLMFSDCRELETLNIKYKCCVVERVG